MTVSVAKSLDQMLEMESDWTRLSNRHRNPLLDFAWHAACATTLNREDRLRILVQKDVEENITAIAPLVLNRRNQFEFLGASRLFEPCDILHQDTEALLSIYGYLSRSKYPSQLSRVPERDAIQLQGSNRHLTSGYWRLTPSAGTPVLDLGMSWGDFADSLSSQRRYDLRRAERRANLHGTVTFESHSPARDEIPALLKIAYDVEDKSWKGRNGSSLKKNKSTGEFFREYCAQAAAQGDVRIFFQRIGNEPASMAICVEKYDALWFLKIGYDEKFRKCSPGLLLLQNTVKACIDRGITRLEHLGTSEPWLRSWTSDVRPHVTITHYPFSVIGMNTLGTDLLARLAGRVGRSINKMRKRAL
jgi:CelD/BcsL family acetyltransferase involved in cellulose biosynthesis